MEKTYKIIALNNYLYAIDEEADVNGGDWCIHFGKGYTNKVLHDQNTLVKITEKQLCGKDGGHGWFWKQWDKNPQFHYSHNELKKIIASNNPSLNVPILPDIEDTYSNHKRFKEMCKTNISEAHGFAEGYKAAKAKKYSEEDVIAIYNSGRIAGSKNDWTEETIIKVIKSLSPIPKAVELEMEEFYTPPVNPFWKLKLTNNNQVIVKQFIYEKV